MNVEYVSHAVLRDLGLEYQLRGAQMEVLDAVCNGQHCISVLPTGYGKSDTFVLPPLMKDKVSLFKTV